MRSKLFGLLTIITILLSIGSTVMAGEAPYKIIIKDHKFSPAELEIPAGKKVKIVVENQDASPEEFESYDLNREKIVVGNGKINVFIGPLKPGVYEYFGAFPTENAMGTIKAVA